MGSERATHRYEMVNVQPGYIIVEHEIKSKAMRSYFSAEPVPPIEEYREGNEVWTFAAMAQSFRFDVRDNGSGEITSFSELLGLAFWASCPPGSDVHAIGELAQEQRVSIYVAVTHDAPGGSPLSLSTEKLRVLNRYYNERLQDSAKKILILPDLFGLYREFSCGQLMIDLGLTAME